MVNWPVQNVLAFTTTRKHPSPTLPLSKCPNHFADFNLGLHVNDQATSVLANRDSLQKLLPPKTNTQWFDQVHGQHVHLVEQVSHSAITADAAITRQKKIALSIMTADCLPILLSTLIGDEVAAIHGGWRPLQQGIIDNTVKNMTSKTSDIVAWLGPCIGQAAFEVGAEVRQAFINISSAYAQAFQVKTHSSTTDTPNKYFADLHYIAKLQLEELGIKCVNELNHCTFSRPEEYYSYRRDRKTGRMATIIARL